MQLIILHYHLNRGGVTSVIENHLRSLARLPPKQTPSRVSIIYGGRAAAWNSQLAEQLPFECELCDVPELEYDHLQATSGNLYDALQLILQSFDREDTILHLHNHSLGKNGAVPSVVSRLAEEGWRFLLQIHDFAEDLRPDNYQHMVREAGSAERLHRHLYPQATQIHYAALNRRDQQILSQANVSNDRLHLLPNPVRGPQLQPDQSQVLSFRRQLAHDLNFSEGNQFVLYPVRPIRRKNLGELLLWSLLAEGATFALTLAPLNPQEHAAYQRWVDLAEELQLPIVFEAASKTTLPFEQIYSAAQAIITTSVAEGFGLVYLEATLAGQPLVGRKLTGVCSDFEAAGMKFPALAEEMTIPANQIDLEALSQSHQDLNAQLREDYGLTPKTHVNSSVESLFSGDTIDFGRLGPYQQRVFLKRLKTDAELRTEVRRLNPITQELGAVCDPALGLTLQHNADVIAKNYAPKVIGAQLHGIYRSLLAAPITQVEREPAIAEAILRSFVDPHQLFPIRLEP